MQNDSKYYDFDPAKAVIFLLTDLFGKSNLNGLTFFLSPTQQLPGVYIIKNSNLKLLHKKSSFKYPDRSVAKEKIKIQKINTIPLVKSELNPQQTILDTQDREHVLTMRFYNPIDDKWDFVFLLIDQNLINSVALKIEAAGWKNSHQKELHSTIKSYYSITYPYLEEIIKNEYRKFGYTRELISTLEKTILIKSNLEKYIIELQKSKKSDLITKVNSILESKAHELNKEIKLSEEALEYIFHFNGEEDKLMDAVSKSVDLTNMFLSVKGIDNIEVNVNFIQIQLEHGMGGIQDLKQKRLEKAENFLNKYDDAAQITEHFRKKITINALAFHSKPPVKPPAISSSIRKYRNEMRYLLATKKSKWTVLRTKFNPIASLINNSNRI